MFQSEVSALPARCYVSYLFVAALWINVFVLYVVEFVINMYRKSAYFCFYRPQRKVPKIIFSEVSVSHSVLMGWVSLVPCPFGEVGISGTRSLLGFSTQGWAFRGWEPRGWVPRGWILNPSPHYWHLPCIVGNRAVRILLECFLVSDTLKNA